MDIILTPYHLNPARELSPELLINKFISNAIRPLTFHTLPPTHADDSRFQEHTPFPDRDDPQRRMGKPVLTNIVLTSEPWESEEYNVKTRKYETVRHPSQTLGMSVILADMNQQKIVVVTPSNGGTGTTKEYFSNGDIEVQLRGAIVNPNGRAYPAADVAKLKTILDARTTVQVEGDFFDLMGVHSIAVISWEFTTEEGKTNVQYFTIQALSDNPIQAQKLGF